MNITIISEPSDSVTAIRWICREVTRTPHITAQKNAFFYSDALSKKECNYILPEGTYLSILYRGPLSRTKELLPSLFDYAREHSYEIAGAPMELCYVDEYETNDENEYLIEIQLPVTD